MNNLLVTLFAILFGWAFFHGSQAMVNDVTMIFGAAMAAATVAAVQVSGMAAVAWEWFLGFCTRSLELGRNFCGFLLVWRGHSFRQACLHLRYGELNRESMILSGRSVRLIDDSFDEFLQSIQNIAYARDEERLSNEEALRFVEGNLINRLLDDGLQQEDYFNGH